VFIDTRFENASPVWWDFADDGVIDIHLLYDHERSARNRAAGHIHFALEAKPGAKLTLEFKNLDNIYNGRFASVAGELKSLVVSPTVKNGNRSRPVSLPGNRVLLDVEMPGRNCMSRASSRIGLSDLDKWLASIKTNPVVEITPMARPSKDANWRSCGWAIQKRRFKFSFAPGHIRGNLEAIGSHRDSPIVC